MEEKCYVPLDIKTQAEFFSGFGKKELGISLIGSFIFLVISLIIYVVTKNTMLTVVVLASSIVVCFVINIRDEITNFSSMDGIKNVIRYMRLQKVYFYKYLDEWELN